MLILIKEKNEIFTKMTSSSIIKLKISKPILQEPNLKVYLFTHAHYRQMMALFP